MQDFFNLTALQLNNVKYYFISVDNNNKNNYYKVLEIQLVDMRNKNQTIIFYKKRNYFIFYNAELGNKI
jgi:hypothetical protein